jgi:hypothetical protein
MHNSPLNRQKTLRFQNIRLFGPACCTANVDQKDVTVKTKLDTSTTIPKVKLTFNPKLMSNKANALTMTGLSMLPDTQIWKDPKTLALYIQSQLSTFGNDQVLLFGDSIQASNILSRICEQLYPQTAEAKFALDSTGLSNIDLCLIKRELQSKIEGYKKQYPDDGAILAKANELIRSKRPSGNDQEWLYKFGNLDSAVTIQEQKEFPATGATRPLADAEWKTIADANAATRRVATVFGEDAKNIAQTMTDQWLKLHNYVITKKEKKEEKGHDFYTLSQVVSDSETKLLPKVQVLRWDGLLNKSTLEAADFARQLYFLDSKYDEKSPPQSAAVLKTHFRINDDNLKLMATRYRQAVNETVGDFYGRHPNSNIFYVLDYVLSEMPVLACNMEQLHIDAFCYFTNEQHPPAALRATLEIFTPAFHLSWGSITKNGQNATPQNAVTLHHQNYIGTDVKCVPQQFYTQPPLVMAGTMAQSASASLGSVQNFLLLYATVLQGQEIPDEVIAGLMEVQAQAKKIEILLGGLVPKFTMFNSRQIQLGVQCVDPMLSLSRMQLNSDGKL